MEMKGPRDWNAAFRTCGIRCGWWVVCVCYVSESVCSYKWCVGVYVCVHTNDIYSSLVPSPPPPSLWNVNIKVVQVRRAWYFFSCVGVPESSQQEKE